jgi:type I restriction enzyme S subunit
MSDLPTGWEWTTIGDVTASSLGKMLDKAQATGMHPRQYLRNINVRWGSFDLSDLAEMDIRPNELDRVLAQPGDVIACEGGEPGRAAVWTGPGTIALQKALHRIQTTEAIMSGYLAHLLRHLAESRQLERFFTGTTIKHLPQEKLRLVGVPLPPRAEQERIIAAIEEHLSRLDAAEASVSSAYQRLEALQQRLLDKAVEGESVLLRELLTEPLRNGLSAPASSSGSIRVVTLTAVTKSAFVEAHTKLIEPGVRSVDDLWMKPGDIFIQRSNTPELVGTATLYNGPEHWAIFPDLLIRARVDETRADPSYLELVLRSTTLRRYFQLSARGIAGSMPKISQPIVEAADIPLPPLGRQKAIVRRLSDDLTVAWRMAAEVERFSARTRSMRRSILAAAFSGQLVPQDPDEEPASVLLERIRDQRVAATPTQRIRARAR